MLLLAVQRVRRRRELERRGGSPFLPVLLCINSWSGFYKKKRVPQKFNVLNGKPVLWRPPPFSLPETPSPSPMLPCPASSDDKPSS